MKYSIRVCAHNWPTGTSHHIKSQHIKTTQTPQAQPNQILLTNTVLSRWYFTYFFSYFFLVVFFCYFLPFGCVFDSSSVVSSIYIFCLLFYLVLFKNTHSGHMLADDGRWFEWKWKWVGRLLRFCSTQKAHHNNVVTHRWNHLRLGVQVVGWNCGHPDSSSFTCMPAFGCYLARKLRFY